MKKVLSRKGVKVPRKDRDFLECCRGCGIICVHNESIGRVGVRSFFMSNADRLVGLAKGRFDSLNGVEEEFFRKVGSGEAFDDEMRKAIR